MSVKKLVAVVATYALFVCLGAALSIAREPEPNSAAVTNEQAVLKETYASDYAKLPTSAKNLYSKLLEKAETERDPARKFALLLEAADVAVSGGDYGMAVKLIDRRAQEFEIDGLQARVDLVDSLTKQAKSISTDVAGLRALYANAVSTADLAMEINRSIVAEKAAKAAESFASMIASAGRKSKSPGMTDEGNGKQAEAKNILKAVEKRRLRQSQFEKTLETLKASPDDPTANWIAGRYLCFLLGKPEGLSLLAKSGREDVAALAVEEMKALEVAKPEATQTCAIAGKWWKLAESLPKPSGTRDNADVIDDIKKHAARLYASVPETDMTDFDRDVAKRRISEVRKRNSFIKARPGYFAAYRLVARKSNPNGWGAFYGEIELVDGDSGDRLQGGQPSASHPKDNPERAANNAALAFDGDVASRYETGPEPGRTADWIRYDMPYPVRLSRLRLVQYGHEMHHVYDIDVEGSNDGEEWTLIKKFTGITPAPFEASLLGPARDP